MPANQDHVQSPIELPDRPGEEHVPLALHRFAAPSGPWPWSSDSASSQSTSESPTSPTAPPPTEWTGYPESHFPNWTSHVKRRSGLQSLLKRKATAATAVYMLDVLHTGNFAPRSILKDAHVVQLWDILSKPRQPGVTLRCLFVGNICGSILQMLGSMYNIEPFFFSSALNGIPSRYLETDDDGKGDHMTITLPFARAVPSLLNNDGTKSWDDLEQNFVLDSRLRLKLKSGQTLLVDHLAVHLIRNREASTLIMLHPNSVHKPTAEHMYRRVQKAGKGIYWGKIWRDSDDPTFMVLVLMWHALYAWDEAMDALVKSIEASEQKAMAGQFVGELEVTQDLHRIRSVLLLYNGYLGDFHNAVDFVLKRPNPAYTNRASQATFKRECEHLILEIKRLRARKDMCHARVSNALDLIFRTLTVRDTKAGQLQGWVTQQITFLTTVFLPPTFIATVFGMNLDILSDGTNGTLGEYLGITLPLILVTGWLMLALRRHLRDGEKPFYHHLLWPFRDSRTALKRWFERQPRRRPAWARLSDRLPDILAFGAAQQSVEHIV
ncbi:hypothetical protein AURDEDRAFT_169022 [Auricularia subglabra TFB-10046 SS5]|nr:hypothetical protein AURDEDRAFT_169022 [Auricularia subglabra TFB-10046 SS5]